jgi:hypothetical protein
MKSYLFSAIFFTCLCLTLFFACEEKQPENDIPGGDSTVYNDTLGMKPPAAVHRDTANFQKTHRLLIHTSDAEILMLPKRMRFGASFEEARKIFPDLKAPEVQLGNHDNDRTETHTLVDLAGTKVDIEFNFYRDSLYSFFYTLKEPDAEKANQYYTVLLEYYNEKSGPCQKENVEEENRYVESCYWNNKKCNALLTHRINEGILYWGFQSPRP